MDLVVCGAGAWGVLELDLVVSRCESMKARSSLISLSCAARAWVSNCGGCDCSFVRERGGVLELDLVVLLCESMGELLSWI